MVSVIQSRLVLLVQGTTGGHAACQTFNTSFLEIWDAGDVGTDHCHGVRWVYKEAMLTKNHVTILKQKVKHEWMYHMQSSLDIKKKQVKSK